MMFLSDVTGDCSCLIRRDADDNTEIIPVIMNVRRVEKTVLSVEQSEGAGAYARRSIGRKELRNLDPFLMLDEFRMSKPAGFPDHPHRGFETVTYVLGGVTAHEDFCGHTGRLKPGDLQWMTAGKGVVHAEMPVSEEPVSKVYTRTPTLYLDFRLQTGAVHIQSVPSGWTAFIYTLSGSIDVGPDEEQQKIEPHHTVVFGDGDCVKFQNKVLSVIPFKFVPEPVLIKVANHTECKCMEPAIIRRNAQPHRSSGCSPTGQPEAEDSRRLCASGLIWDCSTDRCIPYPSSTPGLSGVGAITVSMPQTQYEYARGDNVTLPCSIKTSGDPKGGVITWFAEGIEPKPKEVLILTHYAYAPRTDITQEYEGRASVNIDLSRGQANLRLSSITLADNKIFECRAQIPGDDEGTRAARARLVVLVAPSPPICEIQGKQEYGQNINLTCVSEEGSPPPTYKWESRDVRNLPRMHAPRTTTKGGLLSLYNISKDTSGYYICTSTNKIRSASCNITVAVMPPSMNIGSTAGIIGGVVAALIVLIIVIYCCCCRKKKTDEEYAMGVREEEYHDKETPRNGESRHADGQEDDRGYDDSSARRPAERSDRSYEERSERSYNPRSDYDDRRSDYDDRRSDYDDRRSDYRDRRGEYDDRRGEYDDRRDRHERYDDERRYDDRRDRQYDDDRYDEPYDDR
ncbi:Pirin, partial [Nibea albiflora]